ncbi:transcription factor HES-2 isoform X2 [Marmota marmota marmota]|uniref:transcription factor HES-2 isoform X2 n=1 Tax=Marmota marmota marmota TaxID=9994 RepID=UPI0020926375|nr:transcription factor HES-2 isoform X2 [Marmota marmota marmota]
MGLPRPAGDAAELRKTLKPLLEKRRRARINESLSQLKGLILPLLGREELPASPCPPEVPPPRNSYQEGYSACLARLTCLLPACGVLEPTVSARLLEHLRRRASSVTLGGWRAGDSDGPPSPAPPPAQAPAPSPPAPPGGPGLWRPW